MAKKRKDNMYRFYMSNGYYNTGRSIEVRKLSKDRKGYYGDQLVDSATLVRNIDCECKGRRGSGELVLDKACEKHQTLMASIILAQPDLPTIQENWREYEYKRNELVREVDYAINTVSNQFRWNTSPEMDYTALPAPTMDEIVEEYIELLRKRVADKKTLGQ